MSDLPDATETDAGNTTTEEPVSSGRAQSEGVVDALIDATTQDPIVADTVNSALSGALETGVTAIAGEAAGTAVGPVLGAAEALQTGNATGPIVDGIADTLLGPAGGIFHATETVSEDQEADQLRQAQAQQQEAVVDPPSDPQPLQVEAIEPPEAPASHDLAPLEVEAITAPTSGGGDGGGGDGGGGDGGGGGD